MKLVIVESPSKAKTIQKYLGKDYKVDASGGHVCDLPESSIGIEIDNNFKPKYVITPSKKDTIKRLKSEAERAERVYLATDPDREGEAISWHLRNVLNLPDDDIRIEFNEISSKAVNTALKSPRKINIDLVDAQQARRVLDRLVGYQISPIMSSKIKPRLSAGRVQSPALKMIVDREREIKAFVPEEYWTLTAMLAKTASSSDFKSVLNDLNGKKLKITTGDEMKDVTDFVKVHKFIVDDVKKAISKVNPAAPFTTSTMQQDASSKLGLSSPQTMQIAQQLYEGLDIQGEGHVALVTYIRTDSVRISADAQAAALEFIKAKYGDEYVPPKPNVYKTKSSAQDAHEAIRPISLERTPESLKDKISRNHYRLYKLIYERFLASQMVYAEYDTVTLRIKNGEANREYGFKTVGRTVRFKGFTVVYTSAQNQDEEDTAGLLPVLEKGEELNLLGLKDEQKFTKPPARYTDATLIKAMEENGIGRPSTYATILSTLVNRRYVEKDGKSIIPTELGFTLTDVMQNYFSRITDLTFTARMETALDEIEEGKRVWQKLIADFYPALMRMINVAKNDGTKAQLKSEVTDVICEKCGAHMVIKEGRYGKFLACPNYPTCKNTLPINEVVGTCPICGKDIVKKHAKKDGKPFYGCTGYPVCKFISRELPAPVLCPKCNQPMYQRKSGGVLKYVCSDRNCGNVIIVPEAETQNAEDKSD